MNIDNFIEQGIDVAFENKSNNLLMKVGCIEMNIVSISKVRYVHSNNPTLINTLACS